jgi:hypothetical protein
MKKSTKLLFTVLIFMMAGRLCFAQGFYDNFSWGSFNGKTFITASKDQKEQGPCHIFAALAQVESMYELLYFRPGSTSLDLSEYQMYSRCIEAGAGTVPHFNVYPFLANTGVVEESCPGYDYHATNGSYYNPCATGASSPCCITPTCPTRYKISWHPINLAALNTQKIQDSIFAKGPIQLFFHTPLAHGDANHAYLLYGWTKADGTLKWIFKDSWPLAPDIAFKISVASLNLPQLFANNPAFVAKIATVVNRYTNDGAGNWTLANVTRSCNADYDGDGYCFWGIGTKPCSHGGQSQQDFNDYDNTKGPLLANGYAMPLPNVSAPLGQMTIYGPNQTGNCSVGHTLNSSYWKNITGDQIDWVPYSGSTPTANTGPDASAPGAMGLYLYLEATGGCYGQTGIVESKYHFYIPTGTSNYSLNYYYHMYGSTMGTLKVKIQVYPNTTWVERGIVKSGNKGNSWFNEVISLSEFKGQYIKIRFEGVTGYGEYSDMAIQNISIPLSGGLKSTMVENSNQVNEMVGQDQEFTLFPNPTTNQLHIQTMESMDYNLSIYTNTGKLIYNRKLTSSQVIDVGMLPKGNYIVRIKYKTSGNKVFTQKLTIN